MPRFRAYLHVKDLSGPDSAAVRHAVEESLSKAGLDHWHVVSIESEERSPGPLPPAASARRETRHRTANVGGYLLAGAVAWGIWFFWTLLVE